MNKIYKSVLAMAAVTAVAGASLAPALVNAWGDSSESGNGRKSYTLAEINDGKLGDTITFNSISNSKIGDEKNFVGARLTSGNATTYNANEIEVKDGETYTIRLYVHNNSPKGTSAIAKNVKANFSLPTTVSTSQTIIGYLNSSNATPTRYWDEVTLKSSDEFYIEYVMGSAKYRNEKMGTVSLSDEIISNAGGVLLGYSSLNGEIPGCYDYDGEVTIQVKVHSSVTAKLSKTVRIKGSGNAFTESVDAKVGDEVEFQIEYKNLLSDKVDNVMIRDILPTNMEYVQNSTYLYNSNYQNGTLLKDNTVTTSGINIGSYNAKGNAYVRFTAKVVDKTMACGNNQLVNWASSTVNTKVTKDDASVMVKKDCGGDDSKKNTQDNNGGSSVSRIVSTGPEAIVVGALGAGAVTTVAGYAVMSRRSRK
ncbi:DUF11 domain-containing protein [Candidatus Saccharibacteria bacterium]|nr:DUF11 domain-containing protein [Candidatus Saccharibacteria bacterium]